MLWLIVTISAYLILAIVFLVNKYLLIGPFPNPKAFAFYVGVLGILILILVPFVNFYIPEISQIILSLIAGAIFIFALFWFYKALNLFEASRVVPAIGGFTPLFSFGFIYFFSLGRETLSFLELAAFILLILGSILITLEKRTLMTLNSLQVSAIAAFLFSLSFVLTKYVYLEQTFWNGFIWIRIGGFFAALFFFIFFKEVKEEIFTKKAVFEPKTATIFLSNQAMGAGALILQNWAIFLAPLVYVAIINALQGIQYAFLLIFVTLLSLKFPKIIKEEVSKEVILQKITAILLIGGGLVLLAL